MDGSHEIGRTQQNMIFVAFIGCFLPFIGHNDGNMTELYRNSAIERQNRAITGAAPGDLS